MNYRSTIKFFVVPALALVITAKIYIWTSAFLAKHFVQDGSQQSIGEALIGGKFTLVNQDGKEVTDTDFKGKLSLVYFGFSHCPDICPTDLALITNVMEKLGDDAKNIQPIFITVDPERDTPAELKSYLSNFYPGFVGLTGTKEQVANVINTYRIYAKKIETKEVGEYLMDHSAFIYLMGKDGKYITHFSGKEADVDIAGKIKGSL